ncbi:MAG: CusA/CzcA family heavy metal efflux RND transporter [Thermodesulfovibrionales bacterium]|nr:CusA/CzcA family heavy metal efflux RND transporter [Thermodesulfovibrionales bacterium]
MISRIIEFSAKNRFIVLIFVVLLTGWGIWSLKNTPLDALPDLSETQVIIYTDWPGRSPDLVEDQITYPISSTLLAAPEVEVVRGFSYLGSSFIYVIFKEGTDIYWARSRIIEYLQSIRNKIPSDVNPVLGPDATSLGWGFSYAIVDESGSLNLADLRSLQDFTVKLAVESTPGVAQVASIGGFIRQYQVTVDPARLLAYDIPLTAVLDSVRRSNIDVEGRVIESAGREFAVRGRGYIKNISDLGNTVVSTDRAGTPVLLKDVARIQLGPEIRRGIADLDGKGEVAGGIVIVRFGENVLNVLDRVKKKLKDIEPNLPKGVKIVPTYDRSDLIHKSVDTLRNKLITISLVVGISCVIFLFHLPSTFVILITLPLAILMSFICMHALNVTSNIMSLSGIAIAIGTMVDASIIMVENAHKRLADWEKHGSRGSKTEVIIDAAKEVGPSLFFSLLVITVAFLPVFFLQAQAGKLFRPLAYTKTFAMLFASFLAITLTPMLMTLLIRGKTRSEEENPFNIFLHKIYGPAVRFVLAKKRMVIALALVIMAITAYPFLKLGSEFMPPLYEGSLFYMPVTVPGPSITEVSKLLQIQDKLLKTIPEVSQVFGKAGRAETATDPAPLEMFETVINLKPENQWREGITVDMLKDEMNDILTIPGVANSFTYPIKARIDMLSTGIRTPLGIKVIGTELKEIERVALEIEQRLRDIPGTRSIYAERVNTGYYLDINVKRESAARYNLNVNDVLDIVQSAAGGLNLTTTVEGRERYPVNVRYARELRDNSESIRNLLVPLPYTPIVSNPVSNVFRGSSMVPVSELADIHVVKGPNVIKSEEGFLTAYIYIDYTGSNIQSYMEKAGEKISSVNISPGYQILWSGDFEYLLKTRQRLKMVIPLTLIIIFFLLYFNTKSLVKTAIILLAVPFSLVGSFWLLYILNYNMSTAVWIGIIAMAGIDAETGVIMLLYLDLAYTQWKKEGRMKTAEDLKEAIMFGAVRRIRPKHMTVTVIIAGLLPILFSSGIGSDVMKRIAAPMVGGIVTSTLLELLIYPALFMIWKEREIRGATPPQSGSLS